jgi:hypothetical protein
MSDSFKAAAVLILLGGVAFYFYTQNEANEQGAQLDRVLEEERNRGY